MTDTKETTRNGKTINETDRGKDKNERKSTERKDTERDAKELTVNVETEGEQEISTMTLMRCVRELCGGLVACRFINPRKHEITLSHPKGKERLLEGFRIGETRVHARELSNDELVVSFLNLPYYIDDLDILEKLSGWGVKAVTPIRRRMWPGTQVADGTRYLKVRFNDQVKSLPYSTKFNTALGAEYFRVIHDNQIKVCRMCMQPGHILRECPEFQCHRCGVQGHYARECKSNTGDNYGEKDGNEETTELEEAGADVEEEEGEEDEMSGDTLDSDGEHEASEEIEPAEAATEPTAEASEPSMREKEAGLGKGGDGGKQSALVERENWRGKTEGTAEEKKAPSKETVVDEEKSNNTNESDTDMEIDTKIMQLRKRQNTERSQRLNKKSKNKNKK